MKTPALFPAMALAAALLCSPAGAQVAPSPAEVAAYTGLHAAAARGDAAEVARLAAAGADANARDGHGRTPLMVAAHGRHIGAAKTLIEAKADLNLLDAQAYDVITIAAVNDDVEMVKLAIASGGNARAVTSPYRGTALIAAAHLGHAEVVAALIAGKAPLDHVNNLGWTALIEAILLGDGGPRHVATLQALVKAGADVNLADGQGVRPLSLAKRRGYARMVEILEGAGAKP
jgi:ankyrin repeat protein